MMLTEKATQSELVKLTTSVKACRCTCICTGVCITAKSSRQDARYLAAQAKIVTVGSERPSTHPPRLQGKVSANDRHVSTDWKSFNVKPWPTEPPCATKLTRFGSPGIKRNALSSKYPGRVSWSVSNVTNA